MGEEEDESEEEEEAAVMAASGLPDLSLAPSADALLLPSCGREEGEDGREGVVCVWVSVIVLI